MGAKVRFEAVGCGKEKPAQHTQSCVMFVATSNQDL